MKEKTLSEKKEIHNDWDSGMPIDVFHKKDVAKAVKKLKEVLGKNVIWRSEGVKEFINNIFGDDLCNSPQGVPTGNTGKTKNSKQFLAHFDSPEDKEPSSVNVGDSDDIFYDCDGNSSSDDICECGHERKEHPVYNLYGSIICKQFKRSKA